MNKTPLFSERLLASCRVTGISRQVCGPEDNSKVGVTAEGNGAGGGGLYPRKDVPETLSGKVTLSRDPNEIWEWAMRVSGRGHFGPWPRLRQEAGAWAE